MTVKYDLSFVKRLVVIFNHKLHLWDVFAYCVDQGEETVFVLESFGYLEGAVTYAQAAKRTSIPDVHIDIFQDDGSLPAASNDCYVRGCVWNNNDSCTKKERDPNLPAPQINHTQPTQTESNSIVPRLCLWYEVPNL